MKKHFNSQCQFSFLASSEASTPPVDVEHNEMRTNIDDDCKELQGKFKQIKHLVICDVIAGAWGKKF